MGKYSFQQKTSYIKYTIETIPNSFNSESIFLFLGI